MTIKQKNKTSLFNQLKTDLKSDLRIQALGLSASATQFVFGTGSLDAKIVFVGEAPGREEDQLGKPFVGAAGRLLRQTLAKINLNPDEVFITNLVKLRPPGNRDPADEEIQLFKPHLEKEIKLIEPLVLVSLGRYAGQFFKPDLILTRDHGQFFKSQVLSGLELKLLISYHPAACFYNVNLKNTFEKDLEKLKDL